jgi:hypothetical protein
MALLNLGHVTVTLIKLIEQYFMHVSPVWAEGTHPTISAQSPDVLSGNAIGIYLYHITEDAHYKNMPPPGKGEPPVRYVPMALNLYYQLSAHSASDDPLLEQHMMGIAVKALHDFPIIDDSTEIVEEDRILHTELQGKDNRMKIVLQPIAHNEAVSYWTAGSTPLRLATYYQVSVILLEPEETQSRAGRVLTYGVHTFLEGAPRIESSHNILSFTIPGESESHEVKLRPAQAPAGGQVSFTGVGLAGDSTSLLLKNSRWDDPVEADIAWAVAVTNNSVSAVVQENASGMDIIPGIYSALVKVTRRRTIPGGEVREFEHISNECPFAITPHIESISDPDAEHVITIEGYIFSHDDIPPESVQVYLGEIRLERVTADTLNPGEFAVVVPEPPPEDALTYIQLRLPEGLSSGQNLPLRIFVNGVESPPNWIEIP